MAKETKVRNYKDSEILYLASQAEGFKGFPDDYWLCGIQSSEDTFNTFDDKIYLFKGEKFVDVLPGTTNAGANALLGYAKQKLSGTLVWKVNQWNYDVWTPYSYDMKSFYLHKGKMPALRQCGKMIGYRDSNKNQKAEQIGKLVKGLFGANFHTNTYEKPSKVSRIIKWLIGGWSWGCVVTNDPYKYYNDVLPKLQTQKYVSYVLLKEKED